MTLMLSHLHMQDEQNPHTGNIITVCLSFPICNKWTMTTLTVVFCMVIKQTLTAKRTGMERQRGRPLSAVLTVCCHAFLRHPVKTKQNLWNWYVGFIIHLKEIRHDPQTLLATNHVSCRAYVEADLPYNDRRYTKVCEMFLSEGFFLLYSNCV